MKTPYWTQFNNARFIQFFSELNLLIKERDLVSIDPKLESETLFSLTEQVSTACSKPNKSPYSEELIKVDAERTKALRYLRHLAKTQAYHREEAKIWAGERLLEILGSFRKNICQLSYAEQAVAIRQIGKSFEQEKNKKEVINVLKIESDVEHLLELNDLFEDLYISRLREPKVSLQTLKKEMVQFYKNLKQRVIAHAYLNSSRTLNAFIEEVNRHIKWYHTTIRISKTKRKRASFLPARIIDMIPYPLKKLAEVNTLHERNAYP